MHMPYGITIREALSSSHARRLRLLGGRNGLERVIKTVALLKSPAALDSFTSGTLLLAPGELLSQTPGLIDTLMPRMAESGGAGLVVKPEQADSAIPEALIRSADRYNIPLLAMPANLSFAEITASLLFLILEQQNKVLQNLEQSYQELKRKMLAEAEQNYRTAFIDILLCGDYESETEMIEQGRALNLDLSKPAAVMIINDNSSPLKSPANTEIMLEAINGFLENQQRRYHLVAGIKGNKTVIITEAGGKNSLDNLKNLASALVDHINAAIDTKPALNVGIGRLYPIKKINRSYQEACEALKICRLSDSISPVHFDELGFYKILSEKNRQELEQFVEDLLQPVFKYDRAKNGELINTLKTYYEVNRNLKMTSKRMLTHYNTILYRIRKIEELTGVNLSNPESALNMEIAIQILKLFRTDT